MDSLHTAARDGDLERVKDLIKAGVDVNAIIIPLHLSAKNGHADIVKELIAAGADVNAKEEDGWTPLHCGVRNGNVDIVKALIIADASFSVEDDIGRIILDLFLLHNKKAGEAFLKYALLYQDRTKLKPIMPQSNSEFKEFWNECEKQVDKMKETWLGGSCVSFYEFITETDKNKVALYSSEGNFGIKNFLKRNAYFEKFPLYKDDLESQFNEGRERANLLLKIETFMKVCFCDMLPKDIIQKISEYMTNDDIKTVID